jgi:pyruvate/2-oxoglutarate dehydrogenase complex dihydrolipoamide dehydrogenase (E3) component
MTQKVETIVIGAGMAGLPMALRAARHGDTVLVEPGKLGGTCLNRGCIPTKTMIYSAKVAHLARRAADFGLETGPVRVDLASVVARKDLVVSSIRSGSERAVDRAEALQLVPAHARFLDAHTVEADGTRFQADRIVINTGARPHVPSIPGLDQVSWLDSTSALDLIDLPRHLEVVGGGYVGCELAQMYRRFGSKVTILQRADRLLPGEDPDVSQVVAEAFSAEGIDVRTATTPDYVAPHPDGGMTVAVGDDQRLEASHLLIATGRTPNTDRLDLDAPGVATDLQGFITVDAAYATTTEGVYAIGDVVGPPMFTHTARDDAALLYRHLYKQEDITIQSRLVPHAVFTDPEVASFGLTETQARQIHGDQIGIGIEHFRGVAKARAMDETAGFIKIITGPDRKILGATIVGPEAGNLIHELVVAAAAGLTIDQVSEAMHIHPTLAEGVNAAAGGVHRPTG